MTNTPYDRTIPIKYSGHSYKGVNFVIWTNGTFRKWGIAEKGKYPKQLDQFNARSALNTAKAAIRLNKFNFLFN